MAAFGECCAKNPVNFGIQNGAGVTIIVCAGVETTRIAAM
jgi:hypothetical protein